MKRESWGLTRGLLLGSLLATALVAAPGSEGAPTTFSNPTAITMPNAGAAAPANPYPSVINVAALPGTVADANVTLKSFSHECLSDADILLTGPGGRRSLLLSDAGGYCTPPAVGVTITLDDEATTTYPCDATPSGTFKPTNDPTTAGHCTPTPDAFPPPAPSGPYPLALSSFDGISPNGAWSLFVFDEAGGSPGSITGGWSLELDLTPPSNTFTLGAITRNKKRGTATVTVDVPNPGELTGSGKGVTATGAAVTSKAVDAGQAQLLIKAKGKKKRKLNETGKVKLRVAVTYTPTGGDPSTQSLKLQLKKKL
jgi:hypothetical protein